MLEKYYKHELVEKEIYEGWEKDKDFVSKVIDKNSKPFWIVIPPPNVTGTLQMAHALNNTLQDILIPNKKIRIIKRRICKKSMGVERSFRRFNT